MKAFKTLELAKDCASKLMSDFHEIIAVEFEDLIGDGDISINVSVSTPNYNKSILKIVNGLGVNSL